MSDEMVLPFLIDVDTLNEQYGAEDIECLRCGKCCKMPGTDEYCPYLIWEGMLADGTTCTIYNSRNGRYIGTTSAGKVYCFPRMYKRDTIEGCAYQEKIDYIKRLIKNER